MQSRQVRSLMALLLAFALFMPTFWIIDAMQGETASPSSTAGEVTLRFDESRSEQETLVEPTLRFDESRTEQEIVFDDGASDPSIWAPPGQSDDTGDPMHGHPVVKHMPHIAGPGVRPMVELRLPQLLSVDRVRLSKLLLPEQPFMKVATPPPLMPA